MKIKCPVCKKGYETYSGRPNIINHIRNLAKSELLEEYLFSNKEIPHAKYLKNSVKTIKKIIIKQL